ncbi:MAG: glycosyltransferase family 2 protein [Thermodesulfobacteriota bacterium]|nr:glycosyltransferase family 2 protein [Thermodesulfobacteriota bacterium]
MDFLFYLSLISLIVIVLWGSEFYLGGRNIQRLKDISLPFTDDLPEVSIVIPALNEERDIEQALTTVLSLEYKNKEILVINDRSTDRTAEILGKMARQNPALHVYHIEDLPSGWLGKNHALHFGARQAKGEYLLFTDADIMFDPAVLNRAVRYVQENHLDHLAIGPEIRQHGVLLNMLTVVFITFFGTLMKPWKAKNPKSKRFIGIGAFNLMRTEAYWNSGTLEVIAMRPDDDVKLGKLLKKRGFRQDYLSGIDMVWLEWYPSVRDMINGLMKNTFAVYEYNIFSIAVITLAMLVLDIWPFIGAFLTNGVTQALNGAIILIFYCAFGFTAHMHNKSPWYALGLPIGCLIIVYIVWRSTLTTLINQGIYWRGTHYCLKELRENRI